MGRRRADEMTRTAFRREADDGRRSDGSGGASRGEDDPPDGRQSDGNGCGRPPSRMRQHARSRRCERRASAYLHAAAIDVGEAMPAVVQHAAALGQQRAQSPCRAEVAHHVDTTPGASQRA